MIAAILGALTALVPGLLNFFTTRSNNAFQLELQKLQLQAARDGKALDIVLADRATDAEQLKRVYDFANAPTGIELVDAFTSIMRPYITAVLFHMWMAVEIAFLVYGIKQGLPVEKLIGLVWDVTAKDLLEAVIGFWFGSRMLTRGQQNQIVMGPIAAVAAPRVATGAAPAPAGGIIPKPPGSRD
jgi:hypothetical protein